MSSVNKTYSIPNAIFQRYDANRRQICPMIDGYVHYTNFYLINGSDGSKQYQTLIKSLNDKYGEQFRIYHGVVDIGLFHRYIKPRKNNEGKWVMLTPQELHNVTVLNEGKSVWIRIDCPNAIFQEFVMGMSKSFADANLEE